MLIYYSLRVYLHKYRKNGRNRDFNVIFWKIIFCYISPTQYICSQSHIITTSITAWCCCCSCSCTSTHKKAAFSVTCISKFISLNSIRLFYFSSHFDETRIYFKWPILWVLNVAGFSIKAFTVEYYALKGWYNNSAFFTPKRPSFQQN